MVAVRSEITTEDALQFEDWLQTISEGRSEKEVELIRRACEVAQRAHQGQFRASGEPYFQHVLSVANILAQLRMDHETLAAAMLHDVLEDTYVTLEELEAEFGPTVAKLVDGVTKMGQIQEFRGESRKSKKEQAQAESLRKMFLAMVEDIRVVLIKLADRTHNMRTLHHLREDKRKRIAKETLEIFAPLANRLGIWQFKRELEDLSFMYMEPDLYEQLVRMVNERHYNRQKYLAKIIEILQEALSKRAIKAEVIDRPTHIYSIWRKMKMNGVDFDQIYDVRTVRVLVETDTNCYTTLGIVHWLWRPIPGEFDDFIAAPKDNLYQSLHTAVIGPDGKTIEIQVRTHEMHQNAELGVIAHWRCNKAAEPDPIYDGKVNWLRSLMEWQEEVADASDFIEQVKAEVFQDRVYVLTPKGDVVDLPSGATPIDFAYYIHTEVGHRCRGAKINGKTVPLNFQIQNGDQIEILTTKQGGPSFDWLNTQLDYVKTSRARSSIKRWFKRRDSQECIDRGRAVLERELHRLGMMELDRNKLARYFNFNKLDDFLTIIGRGDLNTTNIVSAISDMIGMAEPENQEEWRLLSTGQSVNESRDNSAEVEIQKVGNFSARLAQCCRPVPGDTDLAGYITREQGLTIHRRNCRNLLYYSNKDPERLVDIDWNNQQNATYPVDVHIEAFDRPGLLHDITAIVAKEKINISTVHVATHKKERKANLIATLDVAHIDQLSRILALIEQLPNVIEVQRR
jgi:GTP pyrophosphokinase